MKSWMAAAVATLAACSTPLADPAAPPDELVVGQERDSAVIAASLRAAGFKGAILVADAEKAPYATDYGRAATELPTLVVKPVSTEDAAIVIRVAVRAKLSVRNRGGGHGLEGQALLRDGIVIATDDLRLPSGARIELVNEADGSTFVRAAIGVKVGEVNEFLARQRLRLRAATMDKYPGLGGALAVSGIGLGSHRHGSMIDQVRDLRGVAGTGQVIDARATARGTGFRHTEFAPGHDGDAANAMLGGMGQFGLVTEVTLPAVPIRGELLVFTALASSRDDLIRKLEAACADTSEKGERNVAVYGVIVKAPGASGRVMHVARVLRDVLETDDDRASGTPPEPVADPGDPATRPNVLPAWLDVIAPSFDHARAVLDAQPALIDDLTSPDHLPGTLMLLIPQRKVRESATTLNRWKNAGVGDLMMAIGAFYYQDRAKVPATVAALRAKREAVVRDQHAQPYLMDGVPTTNAAWRSTLGDAYEPVLEALERFNPTRVFKPFPGLRPE